MHRSTARIATVMAVAVAASPLSARTVTVPIERWKPMAATNVLVDIGNRQFAPYTAADPAKTWALGGTDDAIRFEVRPGDRLRYDIANDPTPKERSEIGTAQRFAAGVPVDVSWTLDLRAPARLMSKWTVLGQMHEDGVTGPPPLALAVVKGNRWQLAVRSPGRPDQYLDVGQVAPITRFRLLFVGGANGHVTLWIDGAQVADVAGPVGGRTGYYWKIGIYRYAAPETVVATYRDLRIASGDMAGETLRPTISWVGGKARIAAARGSRVSLYDGGRRIAGPVAVGGSGQVDLAVPTAAGIHYLSAGGNEIVVAIGKASDLWARMDQLAAMDHLAAVEVTDAPIFDIQGMTNLAATIARYAGPLALVGPHQFRRTAHPSPGSTRIDLFDARGAGLPGRAPTPR